MTEAVVLAAGKSTRTSWYKMTLPLGHKHIIDHTTDALLQVCNRVIVVTGHNAHECKQALQHKQGVDLVHNPDYEKGMFSSIQRGVSALKGDTFFVLPGDQPLIMPDTLRQLLAAYGTIINPAYRGKKGHPVLFRNNSRKGILDMPSNAILRDFIHNRKSEVIEVNDPGILLDIDTDADYERIRKIFNNQSSSQ